MLDMNSVHLPSEKTSILKGLGEGRVEGYGLIASYMFLAFAFTSALLLITSYSSELSLATSRINPDGEFIVYSSNRELAGKEGDDDLAGVLGATSFDGMASEMDYKIDIVQPVETSDTLYRSLETDIKISLEVPQGSYEDVTVNLMELGGVIPSDDLWNGEELDFAISYDPSNSDLTITPHEQPVSTYKPASATAEIHIGDIVNRSQDVAQVEILLGVDSFLQEAEIASIDSEITYTTSHADVNFVGQKEFSIIKPIVELPVVMSITAPDITAIRGELIGLEFNVSTASDGIKAYLGEESGSIDVSLFDEYGRSFRDFAVSQNDGCLARETPRGMQLSQFKNGECKVYTNMQVPISQNSERFEVSYTYAVGDKATYSLTENSSVISPTYSDEQSLWASGRNVLGASTAAGEDADTGKRTLVVELAQPEIDLEEIEDLRVGKEVRVSGKVNLPRGFYSRLDIEVAGPSWGPTKSLLEVKQAPTFDLDAFDGTISRFAMLPELQKNGGFVVSIYDVAVIDSAYGMLNFDTEFFIKDVKSVNDLESIDIVARVSGDQKDEYSSDSINATLYRHPVHAQYVDSIAEGYSRAISLVNRTSDFEPVRLVLPAGWSFSDDTKDTEVILGANEVLSLPIYTDGTEELDPLDTTAKLRGEYLYREKDIEWEVEIKLPSSSEVLESSVLGASTEDVNEIDDMRMISPQVTVGDPVIFELDLQIEDSIELYLHDNINGFKLTDVTQLYIRYEGGFGETIFEELDLNDVRKYEEGLLLTLSAREAKGAVSLYAEVETEIEQQLISETISRQSLYPFEIILDVHSAATNKGAVSKEIGFYMPIVEHHVDNGLIMLSSASGDLLTGLEYMYLGDSKADVYLGEKLYKDLSYGDTFVIDSTLSDGTLQGVIRADAELNIEDFKMLKYTGLNGVVGNYASFAESLDIEQADVLGASTTDTDHGLKVSAVNKSYNLELSSEVYMYGEEIKVSFTNPGAEEIDYVEIEFEVPQNLVLDTEVQDADVTCASGNAIAVAGEGCKASGVVVDSVETSDSSIVFHTTESVKSWYSRESASYLSFAISNSEGALLDDLDAELKIPEVEQTALYTTSSVVGTDNDGVQVVVELVNQGAQVILIDEVEVWDEGMVVDTHAYRPQLQILPGAKASVDFIIDHRYSDFTYSVNTAWSAAGERFESETSGEYRLDRKIPGLDTEIVMIESVDGTSRSILSLSNTGDVDVSGLEIVFDAGEELGWLYDLQTAGIDNLWFDQQTEVADATAYLGEISVGESVSILIETSKDLTEIDDLTIYAFTAGDTLGAVLDLNMDLSVDEVPERDVLGVDSYGAQELERKVYGLAGEIVPYQVRETSIVHVQDHRDESDDYKDLKSIASHRFIPAYAFDVLLDIFAQDLYSPY